MSAVSYARLIRIVRSMEESDLYQHEIEILRGAADARLLHDLDHEERMAEADELLAWLVESERLDVESALRIRDAITAVQPAVPPMRAPAERRPGRPSLLVRAFRLIFAVSDPAPEPAAAGPARAVPEVEIDAELEAAMIEALEAMDEHEASGEPPLVDAAPDPADTRRVCEQAERLLAFHAWLDQNDRR